MIGNESDNPRHIPRAHIYPGTPKLARTFSMSKALPKSSSTRGTSDSASAGPQSGTSDQQISTQRFGGRRAVGAATGRDQRIIRFKCALHNTILDVLRSRGWQETKEDDWDFFWCDVGWIRESFDHFYMEEHVRICHFRNHYELTRKNYMVKNLKRYKKMIEREYGKHEATRLDFFPATFELPSEYHIFVEEFKRNPGSTWIMKPVAKSQGKGIFLFRKLKDITDWSKIGFVHRDTDDKSEKDVPETYVVSRYIENPCLIGGRKFDIRVYVLVNSYIPLKAWLYRSGFARFSNTRFSLDTITDSFIHLTNVAIQKTAPDYDPEKGCKWSLQQLRTYLTAEYGYMETITLFRLLDDIIIKSLQSVQKVMINDKHCFELYGFDVMIDSNLKPWLIEVNASPSLTASSTSDYHLKVGLLHDVLNVVDMENRLSGSEKRVGGFDLIWNDGPVAAPDAIWESGQLPVYPTNTFLGCYNDRDIQLKQLYRSLEKAD
ncbi:probable tubulin polyglutamylase TTLL9 isoform X2 [Oscarella lobularis]|uniref:probable tubulin polyglutamylase TTLL9 isoform X2 n=1 Tax=Oscarella lobularis TaxID=121494 RepID=UPI0033143C96